MAEKKAGLWLLLKWVFGGLSIMTVAGLIATAALAQRDATKAAALSEANEKKLLKIEAEAPLKEQANINDHKQLKRGQRELKQQMGALLKHFKITVVDAPAADDKDDE